MTMENLDIRLEEKIEKRCLNNMETSFGVRSLYESVCHCSRCGNCQQTCPIYKLEGKETFSPRGYNQFLRLLLENKFSRKDVSSENKNALKFCTLCGQCLVSCAAKVPTAEHVLNARRILNVKTISSLLYFVLGLREKNSKLFSFFVKSALWGRFFGFVYILKFLQITKFRKFRWIEYIDSIIPLKPNYYVDSQSSEKKKPTLIYLPSIEIQWTGKQQVKELLNVFGRKNKILALWNMPSGLFSYLYGDIRLARKKVVSLIKFHKNVCEGNLKIVTDSIDVFLFLKQSPQLFLKYPNWYTKAKSFAEKIVFLTDILENPAGFKFFSPVKLEMSSAFSKEEKTFVAIRENLTRHFKKNFIDYEYGQATLPACGYGFTLDNKLESIAVEVVKSVASKQIKTIFCLSFLATLELNYWLSRFYPSAKAEYILKMYSKD